MTARRRAAGRPRRAWAAAEQQPQPLGEVGGRLRRRAAGARPTPAGRTRRPGGCPAWGEEALRGAPPPPHSQHRGARGRRKAPGGRVHGVVRARLPASSQLHIALLTRPASARMQARDCGSCSEPRRSNTSERASAVAGSERRVGAIELRNAADVSGGPSRALTTAARSSACKGSTLGACGERKGANALRASSL